MEIIWLGHSCFKIVSKEDSIVLDPYKDGKVNGLKPLRDCANMVLCSHEHADHNAREVIQLEDKETCFKVNTIDTYHDDKQGTLRGKNRIHIVDDGEYKVAHLGDLGCALTEEEVDTLKGVDVLLIPVGGYYTIGSKQAKDIVDQVEPRIVIPMHYQGYDFGYEVLETVDNFTKYFENVTTLDTNSICVEKNVKNSVFVLTYK